jgi:arylsulfatase A-like enzyme
VRQRGWLDQTLILYISDHGDMLGDHHLWRKSYAYQGSAHIPMLLRWPAGLGGARGRELRQPVELRDVLPTMLEAAGARAPGSLDGRSLLPLARGDAVGWRQAIDLEHDVCYDPSNHWNALTDGRFNYIFHARDGQEQLFDLERDPGELRDLAPLSEHAATLGEWRRRLTEHLAERGEAFVKAGRVVPRLNRLLHSPNFPG